jgi:heptosyltransferase I
MSAKAEKVQRVLLLKMSSLGDVIHTLPALSDASAALPRIRFDWVVEEAFAEVPAWHPAVARVLPVALRRWRRAPLRAWRSGQWRAFRRDLLANRPDLLIDAQGLLKSAMLARMVAAPRAGFDRASAREGLSALCYQQRVAVDRGMHAIERTRSLFAAALGYERPGSAPDYGIDRGRLPACAAGAAGLVFLHGSARAHKCWPESRWRELCAFAGARGLGVCLPWGSDAEHARAQRIAAGNPLARVLPRLGLGQMASVLAAARAVVAVDTGLGHLAAALDVPCVSLYGPTDVALIGTRGKHQRHLRGSAAAMESISAAQVWEQLQPMVPCA